MKKNVCKSMLTVSLVASMIGSIANADAVKVNDDGIKVKAGESIYLTSESQEDKGDAIARLRFDSESQAQTEYGLDVVAKEQMKERLIKRGLNLAEEKANQSVATTLATKKKCIADALSAIKDEFNYNSIEEFKFKLEEAIRLGGINSKNAKLFLEFVEEFETIVDVLNSIDREYGIDYTNRVNTATGLNNAQSEAADRAGDVLNAKKNELFYLTETINHKYGSVEDLKDHINELKYAKKTNHFIDDSIIKDLDNMVEEYETLSNVLASVGVDEGLNEMKKESANRATNCIGYNNVKIGLNKARLDVQMATKNIVSDKTTELLDKTAELNDYIDSNMKMAEIVGSPRSSWDYKQKAIAAEEKLKALDDAKNTLATIVGNKAREIASANAQKIVVEYDHSNRGQAEEDAMAQAKFDAESAYNTETGLKKAEEDVKEATKNIVSDKIEKLLDETESLNNDIDRSIANAEKATSASGRMSNINNAKVAEEKLKALDEAKNTLATIVGNKAREIASANAQKIAVEYDHSNRGQAEEDAIIAATNEATKAYVGQDHSNRGQAEADATIAAEIVATNEATKAYVGQDHSNRGQAEVDATIAAEIVAANETTKAYVGQDHSNRGQAEVDATNEAAAEATKAEVARKKTEPMRKAIEEFENSVLNGKNEKMEDLKSKVNAPQYLTTPTSKDSTTSSDEIVDAVNGYLTTPASKDSSQKDAEDRAAMQTYKQYQQGRTAGLGEAAERMIAEAE